MKIVKRYLIKSNKDLIFAKIDFKSFFSKDDFLILALMELGTNLLKHAKEGEIWILSEDEKIGIASLDRGSGIENIEWVLQKGTSTYKNSLGIGLYQLQKNENYKFEIFSKKNLGTLILIHNFDSEIIYLSDSLYHNDINGDFFAKKGRFLLFGDASGHALKAKKSADFICEFFMKNIISCLFIDDFFKELDKEIKKRKLRGAVLSIIEVKKKINICGVGNISIINDNYLISQKSGIVGVSISSVSKFTFDKKRVIIFSDGIDAVFMKSLLDIKSDYLLALVAIFFSDVYDDKSILIIRGENE